MYLSAQKRDFCKCFYDLWRNKSFTFWSLQFYHSHTFKLRRWSTWLHYKLLLIQATVTYNHEHFRHTPKIHCIPSLISCIVCKINIFKWDSSITVFLGLMDLKGVLLHHQVWAWLANTRNVCVCVSVHLDERWPDQPVSRQNLWPSSPTVLQQNYRGGTVRETLHGPPTTNCKVQIFRLVHPAS